MTVKDDLQELGKPVYIVPRPQNLEFIIEDEEIIQLPKQVCVDVIVRNGFFITYIYSKNVELKMLWDQDIWIICTLLEI